jgi:hypothetical protein
MLMIGLWSDSHAERNARLLPRADLGCLSALQEAGGGALEETESYLSWDDITYRSANLRFF